jgi:catechol 2,3-dioxygenase-like lactoylglutathione lyase family enzyme
MSTTVTKNVAIATRDEIAALIEAYTTERGFTLTRRTVNYGDGTMKVSYTIEGTDAQGNDPAAAEWEMYHSMFDLPKNGLGMTLNFGGRVGEATIIGLKASARKYPVLVKRVKQADIYKVTAEQAAVLIKRRQ